MNNSSPKVTILTPTYNRSDFIKTTVQSVMSQNYDNFEYIILDDGSTDNTIEKIQPFLEQYPKKIQYHYHENKGEALTVNCGWNLASGDYFMVVNSDDPIHPELITESVKTMSKKHNIVITFPNWYSIDDKDNIIAHKKIKYSHYTDLLLHGCFIGPGALINRRLIKNNIKKLRDNQYRYCSDYECFLRIGKYGEIAYIEKFLATHRVHQQTISHGNKQNMLEQCYQCLVQFFNSNNKYSYLKITSLQNIIMKNFIYNLLFKFNIKRATTYFIKGIRHKPFRFITIIFTFCIEYLLSQLNSQMRTNKKLFKINEKN